MPRLDSRNTAAVAALAAVPLIFFGRFIYQGLTLAYDDLGYWFFPWKSLLYQMARQGHIGFWLPYEFCGMPHMADIQRQIFYPPNALFYLIPTGPAMVAFVALHFFIATLLMYAWLRNLRPADPLDIPSALCGALVFGFSSFPVLHLTQLPMLASYVWIPGLLLAEERYWRDSIERQRLSSGWLVAGGIFFCLMLLGGAPQMVFITSVLAAGYGVFLFLTRGDIALGRALKVAAAALVVPLFGLGLAGLQLVPMAELTTWTTRQPAVSSAYSSIGTADRKMLWTFVNPYTFGNPFGGANERPWQGGYTFHEECMYVGVVALMLCAAALGDWRRGGRRVGFFLILALLGIVIALGNNIPFPVGGVGMHDVMRLLLPGFGKFRVPPRWLVFTVVGVSVLAAYGANALGRYRAPRDRQSVGGAAPLACAFVTAFALGFLLLRARGDYGLTVEQARWTFLLLFSTLACAALCRLPALGAWGALGLVLLLGTDLISFAGAYVHGEKSPAGSPDIALIRQYAASPAVGRVVTHTSSDTPTQLATWCGPLGVSNIQGTNPLFLREYIRYLYFSQAGSTPDPADTGYMHHNGFFLMQPVLSPMTRMLNLTDVVEAGEDAPSESFPLAESRARVWDRKVSAALGQAWAVPRYRVFPDTLTMLAVMRRSDWDPLSEALLSEVPEVKGLSDESTGRVAAQIQVDHPDPDTVTCSVTLDRDALMVFSEIYYPGWRCTVDGVETTILRANSILRAVPVKAGTHQIVMRYRPTSFLIGLVVTTLTAMLMAFLVLREARPRGGRGEHGLTAAQELR